MRSFGRGLLKDNVSSLEDALSSDDNFNATIKILAAYAEGTSLPMTMPCAAMVRRPALWGATLPVFGSSLDSGIPVDNCDTTLPRSPRFDALVAQIHAGWPQCEGTIRFSAYRSFASLVAAARMGGDLAAVDLANKPRPIPRVKGVWPGVVEAALSELAGHYVKYLHAAPARARAAASNALTDILDSAHECGDGEG